MSRTVATTVTEDAGNADGADRTDRELKAKQRALWALGDYPYVPVDLIAELGPRLVEAVGVRRGQRVLDVAASTGNAAVPAALAGAEVVASDLTLELFDAGRAYPARHGVTSAGSRATPKTCPTPTTASTC